MKKLKRVLTTSAGTGLLVNLCLFTQETSGYHPDKNQLWAFFFRLILMLLARLPRNNTNLGLFQIRCQYIVARYWLICFHLDSPKTHDNADSLISILTHLLCWLTQLTTYENESQSAVLCYVLSRVSAFLHTTYKCLPCPPHGRSLISLVNTRTWCLFHFIKTTVWPPSVTLFLGLLSIQLS